MNARSGQTLICPQCGGTMDVYVIGADRGARCQYCRTVIDLPELEKAESHPARPVTPIARPGDDKLARYSLIAGIVGLLGIFPLVASAAAILLGRKALQLIEQQPDVYTGEKTARNGILLGWIGLGLSLLVLCFSLAANLFQFIVVLFQQQ